jgi:hypothetical protein
MDNENLKKENLKLQQKKIFATAQVERLTNSLDRLDFREAFEQMKIQNSLLNEKILTLQKDLNTVEEMQDEECNDEIIQEYDELIEVNSTISKQLKLSRINNQLSAVKLNLENNINYQEEIEQLEQKLQQQLRNQFLPSVKNESQASTQNETRGCKNMPNIREESSRKLRIEDSFNFSVNKVKKNTQPSIKETSSDCESERNASLMKQI